MGCGPSICMDNDNVVSQLNVNEVTLNDYLRIDREITEAEAKNPLQPLEVKTDQLLQLLEQIDSLQIKLNILQTQTSAKGKQHSDAVETHNYFIENGISNHLDKDQQHYLDLLSEKEIVSKELQTAKEQKNNVTLEVEELEKNAEHLQELYKKQDILLDRIFGGGYGSLRENHVEKELDQMEAQRSRILEANFKWRQGQMMLEYACKQLSVAVQKWQDLPAVPTTDLESRYSTAAETRNNLVAAGQNVAGAQRYLENVKFPYCSPGEVDTLNKAAQYVFTDMQSPERHDHAYRCYSTTYKRATALLQWFDTVINTAIMKDLYDINERVKAKALDLRRERVRLIRLKVKQTYGTDLKLDQTLRGRDISADELAHAMISDNQVVKVDGQLMEGDRASTPPPLSEDELAPLPSNSVIFGKSYETYSSQVEKLSEQHIQELQNYLKEQEQNHNKIKGKLEEKLMARRQRRARLNIEEVQRKALLKK